MKLVAHLVRADVRRFRLLLAAWVLIEVLSTVFTGVRPVLEANPRLVTSVQLLGTLLFLTRWLGMIVIIPLVVQTHPLVGSDAFWMTRPIPPRVLLASKMLLLGTTFVALPALCEAVLMAASAVPAGRIVLIALQSALFQALWLAGLTALSATTRNLARFALVVGGLLVSLVLLMNIMVVIAMRNMGDDTLDDVIGRSTSSPVTGVALLLVVLAVAYVLIVMQYTRTSARRSVSAGVTALILPIVLVFVWPWSRLPLRVPDWAGTETAARLSAETAKGEFTPQERFSAWGVAEETWQAGAAHLRVGGIEPGWVAMLRLADSTVQFADGATLRTRQNGISTAAPFESVDEGPMRFVVRRVLGVSRVHVSLGSIPEATPAIVLSEPEFRKYSDASGTYRGRFLVDLDHVEIASVLPLRPGAEFREPRLRVVIDQIVPQADTISLRLRYITMASIFDADPLPQLSFYLRNPEAADAVAGSPHGGMAFSAGFPFLYGVGSLESAGNGTGFGVTGNYLRFPDTRFRQAEPVDVSAAWLARAELVILRTVQWGSVTRTVEIPGFEIRAGPPSAVIQHVR
jgi:hypothetical protein